MRGRRPQNSRQALSKRSLGRTYWTKRAPCVDIHGSELRPVRRNRYEETVPGAKHMASVNTDQRVVAPGPSATAVRVAKPRKRKKHKHNRAAYAFLTPWLIGLFGLTLFPMGYSLYLSFTNYGLLSAPKWIGFENF